MRTEGSSPQAVWSTICHCHGIAAGIANPYFVFARMPSLPPLGGQIIISFLAKRAEFATRNKVISFVFNNILASVVLFFVLSNPSFPLLAGTLSPFPLRSNTPALPSGRTSHGDNFYRLSQASSLVKRKMPAASR